MSQANREDFLALLAAVEETAQEYRDSERISPPPAKKIDWLRRDRFERPESQATLNPRIQLNALCREHYKELCERAWKLWQRGMTDLPPQELDIGAGLFALGVWCKKNLPEEKPPAVATDTPTATGKTEKGRRGRKRLSRTEAQQRKEHLKDWDTAKSHMSMKDFCRDRDITVREFQRYQGWDRQRKRRT